MTSNRLVVLFYLLWFNIVVGVDSNNNCILAAPTRTIGFSGRRTSLNCTVCSGSSVFWRLDNKDSISLSNTELMPKNKFLYITTQEAKNQLTFVATPSQNHTVSCIATYGPITNLKYEESDTVAVIVQGLLDAPKGLTAEIGADNTSISLSWIPPHSFAVISRYTLIWNNKTNITISGNRRNYTFVFSEHEISRCEDQLFTFNVGGSNPTGQGRFSETFINVTADNNYCVQEDGYSPTTEIAIDVSVPTVTVTVIGIITTVTVILCCYKRNKKGTKGEKDRKKK